MIEARMQSADCIVCTPWSDLDWIGATSLRHVLADILRPGIEVVIDLRHVDFIDAVGMSALVGSQRRARSVGSKARICNAKAALARRLRLVDLQWIVDDSMGSNNGAA